MNWNRFDQILPQEDRLITTITESGMGVDLIFSQGLLWFPDKSMYVYYVPVFWRYYEIPSNL